MKTFQDLFFYLICTRLQIFAVIFTDRVRSTREAYVLTRVCPSIHLSVHT